MLRKCECCGKLFKENKKKELLENLSLHKNIKDIEYKFTNVINTFTNITFYNKLEQLKENNYYCHFDSIRINLPKNIIKSVSCVLVFYEEEKYKEVNKKIDPLTEVQEIKPKQEGMFFLTSYGQPFIQINIPYIINNTDTNTSISLKYNIKEILSTICHEVSHAFDFFNNKEKLIRNGFRFTDISKKPEQFKSNIDNFIHILYRFWSETEFYAHQYSYIKNKDELNSFSLKEFYIDLQELKNQNEEFWKEAKDVFINSFNNNIIKEKINKMSTAKFKTYFITKTEFLLNKFKKKFIKNQYKFLEEEKESEN